MAASIDLIARIRERGEFAELLTKNKDTNFLFDRDKVTWFWVGQNSTFFNNFSCKLKTLAKSATNPPCNSSSEEF